MTTPAKPRPEALARPLHNLPAQRMTDQQRAELPALCAALFFALIAATLTAFELFR